MVPSVDLWIISLKMSHLLFQTIRGILIWKHLVRKYQINDKCVVIVLPENDKDWNECALKYLPFYIKRKRASRSLLISAKGVLSSTNWDADKIVFFSDDKIRCLMQYYMLWKFFPGIVFFYRSFPQDNISDQILSKSQVTIEELICYGFYRLREVPSDV